MTLHDEISMDDLEVGSLWKGHHTKYVYTLLAWDGDYENGGMGFIKRTKKTDGYHEYKTINLVDLLRAYDKLPPVPEVNQTWQHSFGRPVIIRRILTGDDDSSWMVYSDEGMASVEEYGAMPYLEFIQEFKRVN